MPIYNHQPTAIDPKNPSQMLPSKDILRTVGPLIPVELQIPDQLAQHYSKTNIPIPNCIRGDALVDTGASITCVDLLLIKSLGLQPISSGQVLTPQGSAIQGIYPVKIVFAGTSIAFNLNAVMGSDLSGQNIVALIGRDILSYCVIVYNGAFGNFSLSI